MGKDALLSPEESNGNHRWHGRAMPFPAQLGGVVMVLVLCQELALSAHDVREALEVAHRMLPGRTVEIWIDNRFAVAITPKP